MIPSSSRWVAQPRPWDYRTHGKRLGWLHHVSEGPFHVAKKDQAAGNQHQYHGDANRNHGKFRALLTEQAPSENPR